VLRWEGTRYCVNQSFRSFGPFNSTLHYWLAFCPTKSSRYVHVPLWPNFSFFFQKLLKSKISSEARHPLSQHEIIASYRWWSRNRRSEARLTTASFVHRSGTLAFLSPTSGTRTWVARRRRTWIAWRRVALTTYLAAATTATIVLGTIRRRRLPTRWGSPCYANAVAARA
jgi:hypothetical protein